MKKLQVQSIRIVSRREKSAKRIDFHPQMTVIRGDNDTGKSSMIKSIYWTFGADPAVIDESWKGLDIASAVGFKVEDVTYTIVRHQDRIAVFDGSNQKLISTSRVTTELGPFLGRLFDSGLLLNNRQSGKPEIPPPAFTLLPFYIDQDKGWVSTWSSFGPLGQYSEWQTDVAEFHIGLRNNNFYMLKSKVKEEKTKLAEPLQDEQALRRAFDRIRKGFEKVPVEFNIDQFKRGIEDLLEEAKPLVDQEENFRLKISSLGNRRLLLQHQLNIVSRTITELTDDYEESLAHAECVECPTCGATYHNSIGERFKLMMDEDDCRVLANDIRNEMLIIEESISDLQTQMEQTKIRHLKIWNLLEAHQGDLTLEELLDGAARKQAICTLQAQLDQAAETIADHQRRISDLESALRQFAEPERKKRFLGEFSDLIHNHCVKLKISALCGKRVIWDFVELAVIDQGQYWPTTLQY